MHVRERRISLDQDMRENELFDCAFELPDCVQRVYVSSLTHKEELKVKDSRLFHSIITHDNLSAAIYYMHSQRREISIIDCKLAQDECTDTQ